MNIDHTYFDGFISQIYHPSHPSPELQLNKADSSDTEAAFLDLHLSIVDGFVSCKIYDKRDDFDFEIVIFLSWMVMLLVRHPTVFIFHN